MQFQRDTHFVNLRRWLEMEGDAEIARLEQRRQQQSSAQAERSGETLLDLVVREHSTGLGGRYLLTLQKRRSGVPMPWHRFRNGSPVILSSYGQADGPSITGVVSGRRQDSVEVAVEQWPEFDRIRLDLSPDEVTRKRQRAALDLAETATGRCARLRDVWLQDRVPEFRPVTNSRPAEHLNASQQRAVDFALSAADLAIIHGPPGTGKTTTVVEVIRRAVANGERVLACAPSNTAVDNLLERLANCGESVVRLGHPARVLEVVRSHTLDALVEQHELHEVIRDMHREADQLERLSDRFTRARPAPGQRYQQRQEARELRRHARVLERQAVSDILSDAQIVCATVSFDFSVLDEAVSGDDAGRKSDRKRSRRAARPKSTGDPPFDLLVIDEACQSVEPGCWVPLRLASRVVLAGDHCQLPPTILSHAASREGFDISLMQRLAAFYGDQVTRRLDVQYRMHEDIMGFSSMKFYDGTLTADGSVRRHLLTDLPGFRGTDEAPVVFIDTAGSGREEQQEPEGLSRFNAGEAELVKEQVTGLIHNGLHPSDIAVIAPYAAQVRLLRQICDYDMLEVDTVDGFQGREKEAVIISTVRSNDRGEVGFLSDARRMNVALTRARRKLIVIGDSATLGADEFLSEMLQWFEAVGGYRSVWDQPPS
ncbi:MAG: IGHMBP2 family helicase [Planctomycetaceae bacterium]|nr:IGHMBP2 family helicase [Planctomycetaceae bacterium]